MNWAHQVLNKSQFPSLYTPAEVEMQSLQRTKKLKCFPTPPTMCESHQRHSFQGLSLLIQSLIS